ncbi:N-acetyltransferase [Agrobacterium tumefaciens]
MLIHPEVPFEYTGNGVGSRLAEAAFMSIRQSDRKAAVRCEFMAEYLIRHSKYHDIIVA